MAAFLGGMGLLLTMEGVSGLNVMRNLNCGAGRLKDVVEVLNYCVPGMALLI